MGVGIGLDSQAREVHIGGVELVAERRANRSAQTLRINLQNRACLVLVSILVVAQTADVVTTSQALSSRRYVEENPLFQTLLTRSPLVAYSVKMLMVGWLTLFAMSYLRGRRLAAALGFAAALSLTAPLLNAVLLLHS